MVEIFTNNLEHTERKGEHIVGITKGENNLTEKDRVRFEKVTRNGVTETYEIFKNKGDIKVGVPNKILNRFINSPTQTDREEEGKTKVTSRGVNVLRGSVPAHDTAVLAVRTTKKGIYTIEFLNFNKIGNIKDKEAYLKRLSEVNLLKKIT